MNKFLKQYPKLIPLKEGMKVKIKRTISSIWTKDTIGVLGPHYTANYWMIRIIIKDETTNNSQYFASMVIDEVDFEVYNEDS